MGVVSTARRRLLGGDPLPALWCLVALVVYVLHGFQGTLGRDVGLYAYAGQQVAEGVPPYLGVMNRAGPLAHFLPGVGIFLARLVGGDDVVGVRIFFMFLAIACVGVTYLLARDLFGSRVAGTAAAVTMLAFQGFLEYATYGPREKTPMVLFLVVALSAVVRRRWGVAGLFVSLATLTWQPVFFAALPAMALAIVLSGAPGRVRAMVRVALGGAVPAVAIAGAYAFLGRFGTFLDAFVLINARYTSTRSFLENAAGNWRQVADGYGVSVVALVIGPAALLALAVRALLSEERRRTPEGTATVAMAAVTVLGIAWALRAFDSWPDVFMLLPCAAVGMGGAVASVASHLPRRAAVAATVAWALLAVGIAATQSVATRSDTLETQRASVEAVLGGLPGDADIVSVAAPQPLVLAGQRQPSRIQMFDHGFRAWVDDTWPGGIRGYGAWISRRQPAVLAISAKETSGWLQPVTADYRRVGRSTTWVWWIRRDFGRPLATSIRADLRAVR